MAKKLVSCGLEEELYSELVGRAEELHPGVPLAEVVRGVLVEWLERPVAVAGQAGREGVEVVPVVQAPAVPALSQRFWAPELQCPWCGGRVLPTYDTHAAATGERGICGPGGCGAMFSEEALRDLMREQNRAAVPCSVAG